MKTPHPCSCAVRAGLLALGLASLPLLAGCGKDASSAPPISEPQLDASADHQADVVVDGATVRWSPEPAPATGPAVYLGEAAVQNGKLRIPIRGKGIDALYGVAFRLEFDSTALKFETGAKGEAWAAAGEVSNAKEARPGLVVGVVTNKGQAAGIKVADGILAWLDFSVLKQSPAKVQFVGGRCAIVQPDGVELAQVSWTGGALVGP